MMLEKAGGHIWPHIATGLPYMDGYDEGISNFRGGQ
jgi:hypothetical protein